MGSHVHFVITDVVTIAKNYHPPSDMQHSTMKAISSDRKGVPRTSYRLGLNRYSDCPSVMASLEEKARPDHNSHAQLGSAALSLISYTLHV